MLGFLKRNLPRAFLSQNDTTKLMARVAQFESNTGCELVFHFRRRLGKNPTEFNRRLFYKFKLDQTTGHRGILITLALVDRKFAIWVDEGVALHTGDKLWTQVCEGLGQDLKKGTHLHALVNATNRCEEMLKTLAPLDEHGDKKHFKNEISDKPIIEGEDE